MICRLLALQLALSFGLAVGLWYALSEEDRQRRRRERAQQPIDLSGVFASVDLSVSPAELEAAIAGLDGKTFGVTTHGRFGEWPYATIGEDANN